MVGHVNLVSRRDIEKIVRMGLVITPHTNSNIYKSGHLFQQRLPPERHREITPLRDLVDAGVRVGLVTDNVPISLFWPIWESVARLARVTNERVAPDQALTRADFGPYAGWTRRVNNAAGALQRVCLELAGTLR